MTTLPQLKFKTQAAWEKWLAKHHADTPGIWLQLAKAGTGVKSINHAQAVEVALCYGWIDGLAQRIDETYWRQRFVPRKKQSLWSKINCAKALELIEQGLMQPAGLAAIEQAKANGRWDTAYAGPKTAVVPPDLQAAFDTNPKAAAFYKSLNSQNRYAIIFRLQSVKKPETRARKLAKFIDMLERGEAIYDRWTPKK